MFVSSKEFYFQSAVGGTSAGRGSSILEIEGSSLYESSQGFRIPNRGWLLPLWSR